VLFQRFESEGLAQYSYMIGAGEQAVVIDPRRDCRVYVDAATQAGLTITHILETHRHEDFVLGSVELSNWTGATVLHSSYDELQYGYGCRIAEGEAIKLGGLWLEPLHTPGHTLGHMSLVLRDPTGSACMVFTGDALFAGDVGRCDFYGADKLTEMAGLLYDSVFGKLLPLGDGVIVCPAHGSGSACGTAIAERPLTTIGLERQLNPMLQLADKSEFVKRAGRVLDYPPYFRQMEQFNLQGTTVSVPLPKPMTVKEFVRRMPEAVVLDTRMDAAFATGHVPGSLSIWEQGIPGWAGWLVAYDRPLLLVCEGHDVASVVRLLYRLGYDRVEGFLAGGMLSWHKAARASQHYATVDGHELCKRLAGWQELWILDVRSELEVQELAIPGAHHIPLNRLPERVEEVPRDRTVYIVCGTGVRSTTAASLLQRAGRNDLTVVLGGLAGWSAAGCPIKAK
jgi:hydroxyacylglutathione hydrolase